jgi:large subunit ribosomal protein L3
LSHGHGFPHRYQGSLAFGRGGSAPQRVYKGKKMHGHYGHETVTIQNLTIVKIIPEDNIIIVSGAIPGPEKSLVVVKSSNKRAKDSVSYDLITREIQKQIEKENLELENKEVALEINAEAEEKVIEQNAEVEASKEVNEEIAKKEEAQQE